MRRLARKLYGKYPGISVVELAGVDPRVVRAYVSILCACSCASFCNNAQDDNGEGIKESARQQKNDS